MKDNGTRRRRLRALLSITLLIASLLLLRSLIDGRPALESGKRELAQVSSFDKQDHPPVADPSLAQLIDEAINNSRLASARWGISVISLNSGRSIYERNAKSLLTPASNMKIFTTAVALELLGVDYRWRTSVYASGPPDSSGTINGDLVLYGRGAPDLVSESTSKNSNALTELANQLYDRGVRQIKGNVIGDESYFRGDPLGDGWEWTDLQWYYGAEASALSINGNEVDVNVLPPQKQENAPRMVAHPAGDYVSIDNRMIVANQSERMTIGVQRGLSNNQIKIWGEFPVNAKGYGVRLSVHHPALWATRLFQSALRARGITVDGVPGSRDSREAPSRRFDPVKFTELASVSSQPLSEVVRAINKASLNLEAELLLRTLGRERAQMLSTPEPPGRERGDAEAGLAIIRIWLSRAGIPSDGLALHDGSGLSRLNLVTPDSLARLLVSTSTSGSAGVFRQSLPNAGRDGTLVGRLRPFTDRVLAKTGGLTYHSALSGYLNTATGEVWAFSVICNNHTNAGSASRVIDEIVAILANHNSKPS